MQRVAAALVNYLFTRYAKPIDSSQIVTNILQGKGRLENVEIVETALTSHDLPFWVTRGKIGCLDIMVPWTNIHGGSCAIEAENVFVLGRPIVQTPVNDGMKIIARHNSGRVGGMLSAMMNTIVNNLRVKLTNLHIRVELEGKDGKTIALGFMLRSMDAFTVDENDLQCSVGDVSIVRKLVRVCGMAIYLDPDAGRVPVDAGFDEAMMKAMESKHAFLVESLSFDATLVQDRKTGMDKMQVQVPVVHLVMNQLQWKSVTELQYQKALFERQRFYAQCGRPDRSPRSGRSSAIWWSYAKRCANLQYEEQRSNVDVSVVLAFLVNRSAYLRCTEEGVRKGIDAIEDSVPDETMVLLHHYAAYVACNRSLFVVDDDDANEVSNLGELSAGKYLDATCRIDVFSVDLCDNGPAMTLKVETLNTRLERSDLTSKLSIEVEGLTVENPHNVKLPEILSFIRREGELAVKAMVVQTDNMPRSVVIEVFPVTIALDLDWTGRIEAFFTNEKVINEYDDSVKQAEMKAVAKVGAIVDWKLKLNEPTIKLPTEDTGGCITVTAHVISLYSDAAYTDRKQNANEGQYSKTCVDLTAMQIMVDKESVVSPMSMMMVYKRAFTFETSTYRCVSITTKDIDSHISVEQLMVISDCLSSMKKVIWMEEGDVTGNVVKPAKLKLKMDLQRVSVTVALNESEVFEVALESVKTVKAEGFQVECRVMSICKPGLIDDLCRCSDVKFELMESNLSVSVNKSEVYYVPDPVQLIFRFMLNLYSSFDGYGGSAMGSSTLRIASVCGFLIPSGSEKIRLASGSMIVNMKTLDISWSDIALFHDECRYLVTPCMEVSFDLREPCYVMDCRSNEWTTNYSHDRFDVSRRMIGAVVASFPQHENSTTRSVFQLHVDNFVVQNVDNGDLKVLSFGLKYDQAWEIACEDMLLGKCLHTTISKLTIGPELVVAIDKMDVTFPDEGLRSLLDFWMKIPFGNDQQPSHDYSREFTIEECSVAFKQFVAKSRKVVVRQADEKEISMGTVYIGIAERKDALTEITGLLLKSGQCGTVAEVQVVESAWSLLDTAALKELYECHDTWTVTGLQNPTSVPIAEGQSMMNSIRGWMEKSALLSVGRFSFALCRPTTNQKLASIIKIDSRTTKLTCGAGSLCMHLEPSLFVERRETGTLDVILDRFTLDATMNGDDIDVQFGEVNFSFRPDLLDLRQIMAQLDAKPNTVMIHNNMCATVSVCRDVTDTLPNDGYIEVRRDEMISVSYGGEDGRRFSFVPDDVVLSSMVTPECFLVSDVRDNKRCLSLCSRYVVVNDTSLSIAMYSVRPCEKEKPVSFQYIGCAEPHEKTQLPYYIDIAHDLIFNESEIPFDQYEYLKYKDWSRGDTPYNVMTIMGPLRCIVSCDGCDECDVLKMTISPVCVIENELPLPVIVTLMEWNTRLDVADGARVGVPHEIRQAQRLSITLHVKGYEPSDKIDMGFGACSTVVPIMSEDNTTRTSLCVAKDAGKIYIFAPVTIVNRTGLSLCFRTDEEVRPVTEHCFLGRDTTELNSSMVSFGIGDDWSSPIECVSSGVSSIMFIGHNAIRVEVHGTMHGDRVVLLPLIRLTNELPDHTIILTSDESIVYTIPPKESFNVVSSNESFSFGLEINEYESCKRLVLASPVMTHFRMNGKVHLDLELIIYFDEDALIGYIRRATGSIPKTHVCNYLDCSMLMFQSDERFAVSVDPGTVQGFVSDAPFERRQLNYVLGDGRHGSVQLSEARSAHDEGGFFIETKPDAGGDRIVVFSLERDDNNATAIHVKVEIKSLEISMFDRSVREFCAVVCKNMTGDFTRCPSGDMLEMTLGSLRVADLKYRTPLPTLLCSEHSEKNFIHMSVVANRGASFATSFKYVSVLIRPVYVMVDLSFLSDCRYYLDECLKRVQIDRSHSETIEIEHLEVHPISILLSFKRNTGRRLMYGKDMHLQLQKLRRIPNITRAGINLSSLVLSDFSANRSFVSDVIVYGYAQDITRHIWTLLGHTDISFNAGGLVSNFATRVTRIFDPVQDGEILSPSDAVKQLEAGDHGLVFGTVGDIVDGAQKVTATLSEVIRMPSRSGSFTREPTEETGASALGTAVIDGITGIIAEPRAGAKQEGEIGFVKGLGRGLVGLVAKPAAGVLALGSEVLKGVRQLISPDPEWMKPLRKPRVALMNVIGSYDPQSSDIEKLVQRDYRKPAEKLLTLIRDKTVILCIFTGYVFVLDTPNLRRVVKAKMEKVTGPRPCGTKVVFRLTKIPDHELGFQCGDELEARRIAVLIQSCIFWSKQRLRYPALIHL